MRMGPATKLFPSPSRSRRVRLVALLLLVLLVPHAHAGSPARPDVTDPEDLARKTADIVAAWFEAREEGLRFTVQVVGAASKDAFRDHAYFVGFAVGERYVSASVGLDHRGIPRGYLGPLDGPQSRFARGGWEVAADNRLQDLRVSPAKPGLFSATIPWDARAGLVPNATLTDLMAGVAIYDRTRAQWIPAMDLDRAHSDKVYVARAEVPQAPPAPWIPVALVAGTTLAGAAVGGLAGALLRRRGRD